MPPPKKLRVASMRQRNDAIWTPFLTRKRPVPRGNTVPAPGLGRPRGTVGKASASEARGTGFEPPWLVQWSRWESRPLSLVGNGAGAGTQPIDRKGAVFPRGTGRFLVIKGALMYPFAVSAMK